MNESDLITLTISEIADALRNKGFSCVELAEGYLSRIERLNPELNAFLAVLTETTLQQAKQADQALERGDDWGRLHGVPIAVKDLIDIAGQKTTAAGRFRDDHQAAESADVIFQLEAAGAIIIGKTHLHEYAIGATTVNPHYGPARNPWNTEYSPGGSSGGSAAAVAAGMCAGALGTDTGGSVRLPSAMCNLTGIRPGRNRISTRGVVPMSWTLDSVGPMAHSAMDVALMLDALDNNPANPAGGASRIEESVSGLRVGVPSDMFFWEKTEVQVSESVHEAIGVLVDLGLEKVEISLPGVKEALRAASVMSLSDAAAYHRERMENEPERFGDDVRARLEWGFTRTGAEYAAARQTGREWKRQIADLLQGEIDVLAIPTTPVPTHKIAGSEGLSAARDLLKFTYPFSLSWLPALSMPCGFTADGIPIGIQLIGAGEAILLRVAHAYQQITEWHKMRPEI